MFPSFRRLIRSAGFHLQIPRIRLGSKKQKNTYKYPRKFGVIEKAKFDPKLLIHKFRLRLIILVRPSFKTTCCRVSPQFDRTSYVSPSASLFVHKMNLAQCEGISTNYRLLRLTNIWMTNCHIRSANFRYHDNESSRSRQLRPLLHRGTAICAQEK